MALEEDSSVKVDPVEKGLETTISLRIGEARELPATASGKPRDVYVKVMLDQEEIFRTATVEKTLNPLFGENFTFQVPRGFVRLNFYVCDDELFGRECRLSKASFTRSELAVSYEVTQEKWYPLRPVTVDGEVQGAMLVSIYVTDKPPSGAALTVKVIECSRVAPASQCARFSDPYCTVSLLSMQGELRSDTRKTQVRKRTTDPQFYDSFTFKINSLEELSSTIVRLSLWHQTILGEDVFLGQVHLSLSLIEPEREYEGWYALTPRKQDTAATPVGCGSIRLTVAYHEDYIYPASVYEQLKGMLMQSINEEKFSSSAISILHDVCKDRAGFSRALVKIFIKMGKFEALADRLIEEEVESTTDPNTLFRGNSIASKVIDEFMKAVGHLYLHRTLQTCIDEIFELKRSCEIDGTRLVEGDNLEVNMTNLLFFVEKVLSAITSSALSCPPLMSHVFNMLRTSAIRKFPDMEDVVKYTSVSGFVFLRFFAPAILNPRLFGLRPENPTPVVARSLLLISKTVQNLGNIGTKRASTARKEDYMVPLLSELTDESHVQTVKNYLDAIASSAATNPFEMSLKDSVYREGYLVKRSLRKKKFAPINFKRRYFVLTDDGLSYCKMKGSHPINHIPSSHLLAVERVDDNAFNMKFMMQILQPDSTLYIQAKNSIDLMEWLSALARACVKKKKGAGPNCEAVHTGAFVNNVWTCCGQTSPEHAGCKPVSLAVKLLGRQEEVDVERELHKVYRLVLESQEGLLELKDVTTRSARSSTTEDTLTLPLRLKNICELLIFVKNLELSSKTLLKRNSVQFGSRELPYLCAVGEACVVR